MPATKESFDKFIEKYAAPKQEKEKKEKAYHYSKNFPAAQVEKFTNKNGTEMYSVKIPTYARDENNKFIREKDEKTGKSHKVYAKDENGKAIVDTIYLPVKGNFVKFNEKNQAHLEIPKSWGAGEKGYNIMVKDQNGKEKPIQTLEDMNGMLNKISREYPSFPKKAKVAEKEKEQGPELSK